MTNSALRNSILIALAAACLYTSPARGAVSLSFKGSDATSTSATVTAGGTFGVVLNLISTSEKTSGVDYYLQVNGAAADKFRLLTRDMTGSSFSDPLKPDHGDNGATPGIADSSVSLLNPANGLDLGASIANVSNPLAAGTYLLARYTIAVDSTTPAGVYTLSTMSLPGTGAVVGSNFIDTPFYSQASFAVTVTPTVAAPEPGGTLALLAAGALFFRRRPVRRTA